MRDNALSGALSLVAVEAMRLESAACDRQDAESAGLFGEISAMLLAMADNASSPLLEVILERLPTNQISRAHEFRWRRKWLLYLVRYFMEVQGLTRYAACREISLLVNAGQGKAKISSSAKELAKHLPASLDGFYDTADGKEVIGIRTVCCSFLREELGREPNEHEIMLLAAEALQDWESLSSGRKERMKRLREALRTRPGRSMHLGLGVTPDLRTRTPVASS